MLEDRDSPLSNSGYHYDNRDHHRRRSCTTTRQEVYRHEIQTVIAMAQPPQLNLPNSAPAPMSRGSCDQLQQAQRSEQAPPILPKDSGRNQSLCPAEDANTTASSSTYSSIYEPASMHPDDPSPGVVGHNFSYPVRTSPARAQSNNAANSAQLLWYSVNGAASKQGGGGSYMAINLRRFSCITMGV